MPGRLIYAAPALISDYNYFLFGIIREGLYEEFIIGIDNCIRQGS